MEQIMQAIKFLRKKNTFGKRLFVFLTEDTIKALVKRQVELGISEDEKIDFNKHPVGYFAGYPVSVEIYNTVASVDVNTGEILEMIRLSYNLF